MRNYVSALGFALAIAFPQVAGAQTVTPPDVPANLRVPAGNQAFLIGHALLGSQNYVCAQDKSVGQIAWTLFTPQATLFDDGAEQIITHFFSQNPAEGGIVRATWESSTDTSTVWAKANAASTDPAFVNQNAVAWVLLQVVGTRVGPTGGASLTGTTFIQRVNTFGGLPPSTGCDVPTDLGAKAFIPYTADYVFFKKN
jgi:uncharacterized protein DUF3455